MMHRLTALMLTFALLVTGQGMAFARTQTPAEGQVILCVGHGSVTIYVDADGQPTTAPQLCSDCAQAFLGVLPGDAMLALRAEGFARIVSAKDTTQVVSFVVRSGSARGPPFVV